MQHLLVITALAPWHSPARVSPCMRVLARVRLRRPSSLCARVLLLRQLVQCDNSLRLFAIGVARMRIASSGAHAVLSAVPCASVAGSFEYALHRRDLRCRLLPVPTPLASPLHPILPAAIRPRTSCSTLTTHSHSNHKRPIAFQQQHLARAVVLDLSHNQTPSSGSGDWAKGLRSQVQGFNDGWPPGSLTMAS
jgi:hypothetical protein